MHYLCPSYPAFFRDVDRPTRFIAGALRTRREAGDVMAWLARQDPRTTPDRAGLPAGNHSARSA